MKTNKIISAFLLVLFLAPSVFAQEEENQLYYAIKHKVKPEKIEEYKDVMKKGALFCKEHNYPFTYSCYQSTIPDFYYFYPVKDYNTSEELFSEWWKIAPQGWGSKLMETLESWDDFFLRKIDTLCYDPDNGQVLMEDLVYAEWWINYIKPMTGMKYRKAQKRAVEMQKKAKSEYPVHTFQVAIGMSRPAYITVFRGKNATDLYTHLDKVWENLGEEVQGMINDLNSTTTKSERTPFWRQNDLSYSPE